jgi:hypothetical protein
MPGGYFGQRTSQNADWAKFGHKPLVLILKGQHHVTPLVIVTF